MPKGIVFNTAKALRFFRGAFVLIGGWGTKKGQNLKSENLNTLFIKALRFNVAGTEGFEPPPTVLETAILPLNYVPVTDKGKHTGLPLRGVS